MTRIEYIKFLKDRNIDEKEIPEIVERVFKRRR